MLPAHGPAQLLSRHRQQRTSGRAASCIAARTPGGEIRAQPSSGCALAHSTRARSISASADRQWVASSDGHYLCCVGLCARWHPCRLRLQGAPTRRAICALSSSIEDAPTDSDDSSPAAPWSEDELTELTRQARAEEEAEIGDEWRSMFMDNPMRQLFTYAMEDFAAWLVSEDAPIVTPPAEEVCVTSASSVPACNCSVPAVYAPRRVHTRTQLTMLRVACAAFRRQMQQRSPVRQVKTQH